MIVGLIPQTDEEDTTMAEGPRMTAAQLADKLLQDKHADVLRDSVAWMARELKEADVSAKIGAELGERSLERSTHRNGDRPRQWDTRVGSIELASPSCARPATSPASWRPAAARSRPGRGGPGGLRQRRVDPQGRPAGRGRWACTTSARTRCRGCAGRSPTLGYLGQRDPVGLVLNDLCVAGSNGGRARAVETARPRHARTAGGRVQLQPGQHSYDRGKNSNSCAHCPRVRIRRSHVALQPDGVARPG
jgi:hypothetical protein